MTVRSATADDLAVLEELWRAFTAEVPPPAHEVVDEATELAEIRGIVESGLGWVAEKDGAAVGMILAQRRGPRVGRITDLYVRPSERRAGVADALALPRRGARARDARGGARGAARRVGGGRVLVRLDPRPDRRRRCDPEVGR